MIRIHIVEDRVEKPSFVDSIVVTGHATENVEACAAISTVLRSAIDAIRGISRSYPEDVFVNHGEWRYKKKRSRPKGKPRKRAR